MGYAMRFSMKMARFIIIVVIAILLAVGASAQEGLSTGSETAVSSNSSIALGPLSPADMSSPRATLRGFIRDIDIVIDDWLQNKGRLSPAGYRAFSRAESMLDFSTTSNGDSQMVMIRRILLLKEILARIPLPPDSEIPGADDVADGALKKWTIPGSNITIQRLDSGPHAGEFLFSAATVQRLHRDYRKVKHLPYRTDAAAGIYENYIRSEDSAEHFTTQLRNRLKPIDMSSPRSTLDGFLDSVNRAYALIEKAREDLKAISPRITAAEAREIESKAQNLLARAEAAFDLSQVPEAIRNDVAIESALQLKEIFDRMLLPPIDMVPDIGMVKAERERIGSTGSVNDRPVRWQIPTSQIEIVEIMKGERQGQFLFSAETVSRLDEYYQKVKDLPYRRIVTGLEFDYTSPNTSEGFYEYYISTPGYLLADNSFLARSVLSLPGWFKTVLVGQTVWQWVSLVICVLILALVSYAIVLVFRRVTGELKHPWDRWLKILSPILILVLVYIAVDFINNDLNFTGDVLSVIISVGSILATSLYALIVFNLCRAVAETIIIVSKYPEEGMRASLTRLASRVLGGLLFAWVLVKGLNSLGVDVVPLVAGLGVGGLAVALAARPTLENVIGSFMIYMDKPIRVGQRVKVLGQDGTVESIGLRSTKIRLLTGPQTSIPNEKMATADIENIGRRPYIRRLLNVTITYDTSPEMINRAVEILREILSVPEEPEIESSAATGEMECIGDPEECKLHPNEAINQPDFPPRVFFNELNADSLNILVIYWYHPPEYWPYLAHANWINMQIMERFNAEGIDFAFPTQTLHLAGDEKRPLTVGQRWESEEETFSPSAVLAQAAALGAQAAQTTTIPASDAVRPETRAPGSEPKVELEVTDAPLEDSVLSGEDDPNK